MDQNDKVNKKGYTSFLWLTFISAKTYINYLLTYLFMKYGIDIDIAIVKTVHVYIIETIYTSRKFSGYSTIAS